MRFRIEFSAEAERDFALIFDHLFEIYLGFGESVETALDHCKSRIRDIWQEADRQAYAPFRGESHDELLTGLRHPTIDRAIYWFDVNEAEQRVRVLAISFGGQDHVRRMLTRLLAPKFDRHALRGRELSHQADQSPPTGRQVMTLGTQPSVCAVRWGRQAPESWSWR